MYSCGNPICFLTTWISDPNRYFKRSDMDPDMQECPFFRNRRFYYSQRELSTSRRRIQTHTITFFGHRRTYRPAVYSALIVRSTAPRTAEMSVVLASRGFVVWPAPTAAGMVYLRLRLCGVERGGVFGGAHWGKCIE